MDIVIVTLNESSLLMTLTTYIRELIRQIILVWYLLSYNTGISVIICADPQHLPNTVLFCTVSSLS